MHILLLSLSLHSITVVDSSPNHKLDIHHTEPISKQSKSINEKKKKKIERCRQMRTKKHKESIDQSVQAAGG